MSSPHREGSKQDVDSSDPTVFPTLWSDWAYINDQDRFERYRLCGPDQYEYDYYDLKSESKDSINVKTVDPATYIEAFDPHYKVHSARHFKTGKIFKVLWSEPAGSAKGPSTSARSDSAVRFGDDVHQKIRRFLIISAGNGHCTCLPIMTYAGKGTLKRGVDASTHTIVYSESPVYLPGELGNGLIKTPIRVRLKSSRHRLDPSSRLNYAKRYTIEYNVKVWFTGEVHEDSLDQLFEDYNDTHPPLGSSRQTQFASSRRDNGVIYEYETGSQEYSTSQNYSWQPVQDSNIESDRIPRDHQDPLGNTSTIRLRSDSLESIRTLASRVEKPRDLSRVEEQKRQTESTALRRRASSSSISSLESTTSTIATQSSASSFASFLPYSERLLAFFTRNDSLKPIFKEALDKVSLDKFERNFRKCLRQFAKHLRIEASEVTSHPAIASQLRNASEVIRQLSTNTAHMMRRNLEDETQSRQIPQNVRGEQLSVVAEAEISDEDNDSDGESDDSPEIDVKVNLEDLEASLLETNSFRMFQDNLRLFLNPDPVERALFNIWPITEDKSAQVELNTQVHWQLPEYLISEEVQIADLGRILTITSSRFETLQALSCDDYISITWPVTGVFLLHTIQKFVGTYEDIEVEEDDVNLKLRCLSQRGVKDTSRIQVTIQAPYLKHLELLSVLSWLCAIFRTSEDEDIQYSVVSFQTFEQKITKHANTNQIPKSNTRKSLVVELGKLEKASVKSCWHSLFPYGIVAKNFPVQSRIQGKGLEISFADMAFVSRCLGFILYDNGLIAHGLTSILIPIEELPEDDAVQWHFADKTKMGARTIARISQVLRTEKIRDWHKETQPERLVQRRCFLGWAEKGNVVIGTRQYETKYEWSRAPRSPGLFTIKTYAFTFAASAMGWVTAQGCQERTRTSMKSSISQAHQKDLYDIIATSSQSLVLLYDNALKIGWCLPEASVVLQIAHTIISMRGYELFNEGKPIDTEDTSFFATVQPDGAAAACIALKSCAELTVRKGCCRGIPIEESFVEIIQQTWHSLNNIGEGLDAADSDFQTAGHVAPRYLHGIELIDAANMESLMHIKRVELNQPWAHLSGDQPIVLLSKNIPAPIVPEQKNLCESWETVPSQQNYLVAMGIAVRTLLERREDGLADRLDWHDQKQLIQSHQHTKRTPIYHAQKLKSIKKPHSNESIRRTIELNLQSCLVFGNGTEKACREALPSRPTALDSSTTTTSLMLPSRIPSSASNTSAEPNSSIACQSGAEETTSVDLSNSESGLSTVSVQSKPPPSVSGIGSKENNDPRMSEHSQSTITSTRSETAIELDENTNGHLDENVMLGSKTEGDWAAPTRKRWKGKGRALISAWGGS